MHVKTLVSALTLSAALALSGSAYAQTMIGSMTISEDDLPAVEQRCNQLMTAATTESLTQNTDGLTGDDGDDSNQTGGDANAGGADATIEDAPAVNEIQDATSTIDLETITLQQCQEAGIGANM